MSRSPFFPQTELGIHINKSWMSINMCSVCVMSISDTTASARFLANWILLPRWNSWWLFFSMASLSIALFFYYYTISVDTCIVISFPAIVSILRQCVGFLLLKGCISLKKGLSCMFTLERERESVSPFKRKLKVHICLKRLESDNCSVDFQVTYYLFSARSGTSE